METDSIASQETKPGRPVPWYRPDRRCLALALRLMLGLVLMVSGIIKLLDLGSFIGLVTSYGWVTPEISQLAGVALPILELLCGALIAAGVFLLPAVITSIALTLLFIVVNSLDLASGGRTCGCFGNVVPLSSGYSLILDLAMLVCAGLILASRNRGPALFK